MFIIETKIFLEFCQVDDILQFENDSCVIQRQLSDPVLEERIIPIWKSRDKKTEIIVKIDEHILKLFKNFFWIKINYSTLECDGLTYKFLEGDFLTWGSYSPSLTCIMTVPNISHIHSDVVKVGVNEKTFFVKDKLFCENFFVISKYFDVEIEVGLEYLLQVFGKHPNRLCKIYIKESNPLCIEIHGYGRYYIAPIMDEE